MNESREIVGGLLEELDERKAVELTSRLIQFESVNPPGDMGEISRYLAGYLKNEGFDVRTYEPEAGRYGVLVEAGEGKIDRTLVLNGHMDVVPPGDTSRWDYPPYSGKLEDGYILGRGASDMKGGLAGTIVAFIAAAKYGKIPGKLILMLVPDEESGGCWGTRYFLENHLDTADGCLIGEPSGLFHPTIGQKGALWLKVTASGVPAHGSLYPFEGDSAIINMTEAIDVLSSLPDREVIVPEEVKEIVEYSKKVITERKVGNGGHSGEALHTITCNIGTITGGDKVNKVPEQCEIEVDVRVPLGTTSDRVMKYVNGELEERDIQVKVERKKDSIEPNYTAPEEAVVTSVINSINSLQEEKEAGPTLQWASSDAKFFSQEGIPTVQYRPAELEGIHSFNEKVKTSDIEFATRVYLATIANFMHG